MSEAQYPADDEYPRETWGVERTGERTQVERSADEFWSELEKRKNFFDPIAHRERQPNRQPQTTTDHLNSSTNQGAAMSASTASAQQSNEVTGVQSLITYLTGVAAAHAGHGQGEGFVGSLKDMEVGADDQQLVLNAQEASRNAARLWADAAASVRANNDPVNGAYSVSPNAGNKHANTNE